MHGRKQARALAELAAYLTESRPAGDRDVVHASAALRRLREGRVPFDVRAMDPTRNVLPEAADESISELRWRDAMAVALRHDPFFGPLAEAVASEYEDARRRSRHPAAAARRAAELLDHVAAKAGIDRAGWERLVEDDSFHHGYLGVERELRDWFASFDVLSEAREVARSRIEETRRRTDEKRRAERIAAKRRARLNEEIQRRRETIAERAAWVLVAGWRDRDMCRRIAESLDRDLRERVLGYVDRTARPLARAAIHRVFESVPHTEGCERLDESVVVFGDAPPPLGANGSDGTDGSSEIEVEIGSVRHTPTPHPIPEAEPPELPEDGPAEQDSRGATRFTGVVRDRKALIDAVRGRLGESFAIYVKNILDGAPFENYDRRDLVAIRDVAADLAEKDFAMALDDWIAAQETVRTMVVSDPSSGDVGDVPAHPVKVREPDVLLALAARRYGDGVRETLGRMLAGESDLPRGHLGAIADLARERAEADVVRHVSNVLGEDPGPVADEPAPVSDPDDFAAVVRERWGEESAGKAVAWAAGDDSIAPDEAARLRLLADRVGFRRREDGVTRGREDVR